MEDSHRSESIASHVAKTFESFRDLEGALAETDSFDDSLEGVTAKNFLPAIENDFTRFKMWAGNQAAHQSGPSSLDHRLREAPHLQQQVIYLLKDICESLQDALSKAAELSEPRDQTQESGRDRSTQDDDASSMDSAQDEESDFSDSDFDSDGPTGVLSTFLLDIGEAIDCLLRLSVAIANPAPHERFRKLGAGPSEDVSFYEPHDIAYVRDKFPKISDELANVLGKFITRRRQFFKYRHAHHEKLASGIETLVSNKEIDTCRTAVVPKTVASSLPDQFKTLATFDPHAAVIDEDVRSDTRMSQTSYATSAGFALEGTDQETCKPTPPLRVPPRPSAAEDGIFECPFCYRIISAKTRTAWKRHVFGDLRPYTCVLSHCTESNTDFDRRHNWQLHVSKYHWRSWSCPFKCQQPFSSAAELSSHIKYHHLPTGSEDEIKSVTALGKKPAPDDTSSHCLLCGHSVTGLKEYVKHVGRHLEQLTLFALPSLETKDEEGEMGSNEQNSVKSGTDANSLDYSLSPSPIPAPLQEPGLDYPPQAMVEEEFLVEELEEEETGQYGSDKNPEDLHSLGDIAWGSLLATHDFSESIRNNIESSIEAQSEQQRRRRSAESIDKLPLLGNLSNTMAVKHLIRLQYKIELIEARLKFEAELKRETERKEYQTVEERQQAEELCRMRFEAEAKKLEERRNKEEEERKRADELVHMRYGNILQEYDATKVERVLRLEEQELEILMRAQRQAKKLAAKKSAKEVEKLEDAYLTAEEAAVTEAAANKTIEETKKREERERASKIRLESKLRAEKDANNLDGSSNPSPILAPQQKPVTPFISVFDSMDESPELLGKLQTTKDVSGETPRQTESLKRILSSQLSDRIGEAREKTLLELKFQLSAAKENITDEKARKRVEELELALKRFQEDGIVGPPLSSHKVPLGGSESQKSADDSMGKGLPETPPEPKESMDMAHQTDRSIDQGQGLPQLTQLSQDMTSLSQEDKDKVVELTTKFLNTASEQQKSHTRSHLQTRMSPAQVAEMESQGTTDPLIWFYQIQAFQVLKTNGALDQGQLGLDTLECNECLKIFKKAEDLRRHKLIHSPPDFECPVQECEKTFHHKELLDHHISRHTEYEKPRSGKERRYRDDTEIRYSSWPTIPNSRSREEAPSTVPSLEADVISTQDGQSLAQPPTLQDETRDLAGNIQPLGLETDDIVKRNRGSGPFVKVGDTYIEMGREGEEIVIHRRPKVDNRGNTTGQPAAKYDADAMDDYSY